METVFESSIDEYGEPPIEIVCQDCGASKKFLTVHPEELPQGLALLAMYFGKFFMFSIVLTKTIPKSEMY